MKLTEKELRAILTKPPGTLTVDDLRWLRPDHLANLSQRHVAGLTAPQLLGMTAKQLGALTQEQVAVLSLEQMGLVPASVKRREHRLAVNLARVEQAATVSTEQAVMRRQWRAALIFFLILPILKIAHKLNLI